jgi:hypothetical protein
MNNSKISDHIALKQRLMHLRSEKFEKEELIERNVKELYYSLDPVVIIKNAVRRIGEDKELRHDVLASALNIGSDFIIGKLFRSNKSIKGFISSLFLERLSSNYVGNHISEIKSTLGSLLNRFISKK